MKTAQGPVEAWAYRDAGEALRARRDHLLAQHRTRVLPSSLASIYGARFARIAAGAVAIVGAAAMLVTALLGPTWHWGGRFAPSTFGSA
jgi:hypothetical protein